MSQKVTRKGPIGDDKEKRHTDSPVKEMKKKMAANAEKEKQAADKEKVNEKSSANEKQTEKSNQNEKASEKPDKSAKKDATVDKKDKPTEKVAEKAAEKKDKVEKKEKSVEKAVEKKDKPVEKKEAVVAPIEKAKDESKENGKAETSDKQKRDANKPKQNGSRLNGDHDATVSSDEDDQLFPELAYEDSDGEGFEPPAVDGPSRSYTRRDQVKASRTPETPRPASDKQTDKDYVPEDLKESRLLKLKDDVPSDRKLRSSDSPKPQDKKEIDAAKPQEKKEDGKQQEKEDKSGEDAIKDGEEKIEVEIAIEVEADECGRKPDTNYSRSRVKVSPYRRARHADVTCTSITANYTGNNSTMEMDVTETSVAEEALAESPYLSGLRSIRGRRSYKLLGEMRPRAADTRSLPGSEPTSRPTGTVVGRKRKPESDTSFGAGTTGTTGTASTTGTTGTTGTVKRARLLDRLAPLTRPFRLDRLAGDASQIVGINTDLPLTAPVAAPDTFDPESIKLSPVDPPNPTATPTHPAAHRDKRCSIM